MPTRCPSPVRPTSSDRAAVPAHRGTRVGCAGARVGRALAAVGAALALAAGLGGCGGGGGGGDSGSAGGTGEEIYLANCATCHGTDGQGGVGPRLAGVAAKYPVIDDQIAVVANGRATMPGFGSRLGADEIRRVVVYERTKLSG